jgi:putative transposase
MYLWRKLTPEQQREVLAYRIQQHRPWHSPPLLFEEGQFHLSAACYEHQPHIGFELSRMADFTEQLLAVFQVARYELMAWCVLPNHYHLLAKTRSLKQLKQELGRLHGRTAREWNQAEQMAGRTIWHRCADRAMRSERHYWATVNYIHNNPVHHGYVAQWTDWPFSSAHEYLESIGREKAREIWLEHPVLDYGAGWDDPEL